MKIPRLVGQMYATIARDRSLKRVTIHLSETQTLKVTRKCRPAGRGHVDNFIVTLGPPNYAERQFIKLCRKAKQRLPIHGKKQMQFQHYPKKKRG